MPVNPAIFKAYDIRGVVPGEIDEDIAERVGRAMVIHTRASAVIIGRDMRTSSPGLAAAVIRGVQRQGATAIDVGLCSTPMFNFAVASDAVVPAAERAGGRTIAGIMVSASHNPAKYNGFKLDYSDGLPVSAVTGMREIQQLVSENAEPQTRASSVRGRLQTQNAELGVGTVTTADVLAPYLTRVTSLVDPASLPPMRIVICGGNGMGGVTLPHLAPRIPGAVIPLHWELDGLFPNHEANPIKPENVVDVGEAVRSSGANVGFAYDGDADRLGVIDERGQLVRGDLIGVLLAREVLRNFPGGHVLCDVRASRVCAEDITSAGGTSEPTRVGHALIKKHLRDVLAAFAGELSGHYYFTNFYGVESTELAMLMLLQVLARERKPLSAIIAPLERYAYSGEVNFEVRDKSAVLAALEARYRPHAREVSPFDGLKFDMGPWWFLVRPSNTEPLLRLIVEAPTQEEMERRVAELSAVIGGQ